jgi:DNA-3-methyladenine glycosylase
MSFSSKPSRRLSADFFIQNPVDCARGLIGTELVRGKCSGIVVETEAYAAKGDEAAHTFFRKSARDFVANKKAGAAYVYLNYGMYWLTNVLLKGETAGFVLIRALEPKSGIALMKKRRKRDKLKELCSGPGKLTIAMDIDGRHHGKDYVSQRAPFYFLPRAEPASVETCVRIGITKSVDLPWRFLLKDSEFVSAPKKGRAL